MLLAQTKIPAGIDDVQAREGADLRSKARPIWAHPLELAKGQWSYRLVAEHKTDDDTRWKVGRSDHFTPSDSSGLGLSYYRLHPGLLFSGTLALRPLDLLDSQNHLTGLQLNDILQQLVEALWIRVQALRDLRQKLNDLLGLEAGWADGLQPASHWGTPYGKSFSSKEIDWLAEQFAKYYDFRLEPFYLSPVPDGIIHIEWPWGSWQAVLEIDLATRTAEWTKVNVETLESAEHTLALEHSSDWDWLNSELRGMLWDVE